VKTIAEFNASAPQQGEPIRATTHHPAWLVKLATKWLGEYFDDGKPRRPGDLEDDFCGQWSIDLGPWRSTPFYPALANLVHQGRVVFGVDGEGTYWYAIPGKLPEGVEHP
jgi:hypothetical protein